MTDAKFLADTIVQIGEATAELKNDLETQKYLLGREEGKVKKLEEDNKALQVSREDLKDRIVKSSNYSSELFEMLLCCDRLLKKILENYSHDKETDDDIQATIKNIQHYFDAGSRNSCNAGSTGNATHFLSPEMIEILVKLQNENKCKSQGSQK